MLQRLPALLVFLHYRSANFISDQILGTDLSAVVQPNRLQIFARLDLIQPCVASLKVESRDGQEELRVLKGTGDIGGRQCLWRRRDIQAGWQTLPNHPLINQPTNQPTPLLLPSR
ncbi:hypothetical protein BKA65DRAFT_185026 [Rhexocercosporidium sp. MPI-PUGE-AT-0058]|nr:hypothetical protein BKA65DRAFT_185026 [Rhexocercosporidium sp. MPI-PUGE-AT-0058]